MFNSNILDVAIGMIFIYLLLSLMCSAANEIIELMLKKRAIDLERGIRELLAPGSASGTADIVQKLYDHALINNLFGGTYGESRIASPLRRILRTQLPSYIPARNFALALMDLVGTVPATGASEASAEAAAATQPTSGAAGAMIGPRAPASSAQLVVNVTPPEGAPSAAPLPATTEPPAPAPGAADNPLTPLRNAIAISPLLPEVSRRSLITLVDAAGSDVVKARENIENWFNSSMDRVSSWYKRRAQITILIIGLFVAIAVNVDTIIVAKRLSTDKAVRDSLVNAADAYATANASPSPTPASSPSPTPTPTPAASGSVETTTALGASTTTATSKPAASTLPSPPPECVAGPTSDKCLEAIKVACQDENSEKCSIAKGCSVPESVECRRTKNLLLACRDEDSAKCKYLMNEQQLRSLGLPIGWDSLDDPTRKWPGLHLRAPGGWFDQIYWHWLGWILTALAISLGAPFWFDLLNKFIVIRSAVKPHEKSPEEKSKD
jgi:hypothetical protein